MKKSKGEEGYLLFDAMVGILILVIVLVSLAGLFGGQLKAVERQAEETRNCLLRREAFTDELQYEF